MQYLGDLLAKALVGLEEEILMIQEICCLENTLE